MLDLYITYNNGLKMDSRPKCKSETIKPLKYYNIGENLHAIIPGNNYLDMMSKI